MLRTACGSTTSIMRLPVGHADGAGRLGLPLVHADDAAAHDLGHVRAGVDGNDQDGRRAASAAATRPLYGMRRR